MRFPWCAGDHPVSSSWKISLNRLCFSHLPVEFERNYYDNSMVNGALYHCKVSASHGEWGLQFGLQAGCCRCWRKASSRSWPRVARLQIHHCDLLCFALSHFGPPEGGSCCKLWVRIQGIILGFRPAVKAPAINFFCSSHSQGFSTLFISLGKSYWWRLSDFSH